MILHSHNLAFSQSSDPVILEAAKEAPAPANIDTANVNPSIVDPGNVNLGNVDPGTVNPGNVNPR